MDSDPPAPPGAFHLDAGDVSALQAYLRERGFAETAGGLRVEKAGEGNMNCVLRVRMGGRSLVVKQARPWVEKYPSIAAPVERAAAEARFYETVGGEPELVAALPGLLDFDGEAAVLILEDLAPADSLMDCFGGGFRFDETRLEFLAHWLGRLHDRELPPGRKPAFSNPAMRQLNHEHIFDLPLRRDSGSREMLEGVTPGLDEAGDALRGDAAYCERVRALGQRYLGDGGSALLHGDFFPGSLLLQESGELKIIDPEFSFCGDPEFDLGVFLGHLVLSGHTEERVEFWMQRSLASGHRDKSLLRQYAGVEIMRRLLGVAQLPIKRTLEEKRLLLERSREWVLG